MHQRGFQVGAVLALLVVAVAVAGPLLAPHANVTDYTNQLAPPDRHHWLGTDQAGRDQLARTAAGARASLTAVAIVFGLTTAAGLAVGGMAGYVRGVFDALVARVIDVMLGLPPLIIALAIVGALGVGTANLVMAIVVTGWAYPARIARSIVLGSHGRLDVTAARLAGVGRARVFLTHVVPGAAATVVVAATTTIGDVVLALAGLSFLGLGAQPPTAELGQMLAESQSALVSSPWLLLGPGLVIVLTVAAAMLISDTLRDALDPSLSRPVPRPRTRQPAQPQHPVASAAADYTLSVRDLAVTYADGTRALRGVTLAVQPDECLAVVGESGCGKSTLARSVLRLLPESTVVEGGLNVGGADLLALGRRALRRTRGRVIGYVGQDPFAACDPLRSVGRNVTEAWLAQRVRPERGEVAARVADLGVRRAEARLAERPHCWSGGMLQRATIVAATAHRPVLTVADEPTSALDADLADDVLSALRETSRTLLLVSHDLRLVARHSDRVAVMYAGRLVETGPTPDVLGRPRHPYTQALLAATPQPGGPPVRSLPGSPPSLAGDDLGGCSFAPRCPDATSICHEREPVLVAGVACWNVDVR